MTMLPPYSIQVLYRILFCLGVFLSVNQSVCLSVCQSLSQFVCLWLVTLVGLLESVFFFFVFKLNYKTGKYDVLIYTSGRER